MAWTSTGGTAAPLASRIDSKSSTGSRMMRWRVMAGWALTYQLFRVGPVVADAWVRVNFSARDVSPPLRFSM